MFAIVGLRLIDGIVQRRRDVGAGSAASLQAGERYTVIVGPHPPPTR